jgi:hypothetical protein
MTAAPPRRLPRSAIVVLWAAALAFPATSAPASAQAAGGRQLMEQCVNRVLSRLGRARAPEGRVGPAVLSECDGPLRAALAEAIQSGEAPVCTVETCIGLARSRAAEEATEAYRQRVRP